MIRLRDHYDGQQIVLDQPAPPERRVNTPVEIMVPDTREQALREWEAFLRELWSRPAPSPGQAPARRWLREEFYERGGEGIP